METRKRREIAAPGKHPSKGPDSRSLQIMPAKLRQNLLRILSHFAVLPPTATRYARACTVQRRCRRRRTSRFFFVVVPALRSLLSSYRRIRERLRARVIASSPPLGSAKHSLSNPLLKSSYDAILGNCLTMPAKHASTRTFLI